MRVIVAECLLKLPKTNPKSRKSVSQKKTETKGKKLSETSDDDVADASVAAASRAVDDVFYSNALCVCYLSFKEDPHP